MRILAIILLSLVTMVQSAQAAELFGTVDEMTGTASLTSESGAMTKIATGDKVYVGQTIVTGADGEVHIVTEDSGLIALRPNSRFRIDRYQAKGEDTDEVAFSLFRGALRSITGWIAKHNPSAYSLNTPTATIGVRGTDHETIVLDAAENGGQPGTYDTVYEGATVMKTTQGSLDVKPGQYAFTPRGMARAPALLARMPLFLEHRKLRLERRLLRRKQTLRRIVLERLRERGGAIGEGRGAERRKIMKRRLREERFRERRP
jgi:hypothetical protein